VAAGDDRGLRERRSNPNLARDDRVSLTIDHDKLEVMATTGLSMAARAQEVADCDETAGLAHAPSQSFLESFARLS
jgi:hypothetical protein